MSDYNEFKKNIIFIYRCINLNIKIYNYLISKWYIYSYDTNILVNYKDRNMLKLYS